MLPAFKPPLQKVTNRIIFAPRFLPRQAPLDRRKPAPDWVGHYSPGAGFQAGRQIQGSANTGAAQAGSGKGFDNPSRTRIGLARLTLVICPCCGWVCLLTSTINTPPANIVGNRRPTRSNRAPDLSQNRFWLGIRYSAAAWRSMVNSCRRSWFSSWISV
jgi:hypothetical protein